MIKETLAKQHGKSELGPKHYEQVKNIEGNIEKSEYKIAKERYTKIHEELKSKEVDLKDKKIVFENFEKAILKLETIENQYHESYIEGKRKIIGSIFPKKFQFENNKVRTADINPLFLKIASIKSASQGIKKRTNSKKLSLSPMVTSKGFEPPTLRAEI